MPKRRTQVAKRVDRIAGRLAAKYRGRFAAIDPHSGRYFVGADEVEVVLRAHSTLPMAKFEIKRLGSPFTHVLKGLCGGFVSQPCKSGHTAVLAPARDIKADAFPIAALTA